MQRKPLVLGLFAAICLCSELAHAQQPYFAYPPYGAQRGRMVHRDGLGHSERYRWGNGLTPTGGAVLTEAIHAFAPAVVGLVGGGRDIDDANRSGAQRNQAARTLADLEGYIKAQQEANELLRRTEALVKKVDSGSPQVPAAPADFGRKMTREEVQKAYGNNPWKE